MELVTNDLARTPGGVWIVGTIRSLAVRVMAASAVTEYALGMKTCGVVGKTVARSLLIQTLILEILVGLIQYLRK
jgi:hypothetical protein